MTDHGDPALLAAKLMPPELRAPSLRADQLERVVAAARARLLLVRAPAGYGKTTLVAAAAAELGWRYVWYRLDPLDADPHHFFGALRSALAAALPHSAALRTPAAPAAQRDAAQAAARLAADLGRAAPGDLYLVLDDYEALAGAAAFDAALAALLSYLPAAVHVVLLSRVRPAFATTKLALDGALAEITHGDLRFDGAQVAEVIAARADDDAGREGAPAASAAIEALLGLTEGWPAGVLLIAACGRLDAASLDVARSGEDPGRAAYPYLAEQVYARLDAEAQDFLRGTCCLETTTPALAESVTGVPGSGRQLERLEAGGAFTFAEAAGGSYRVHPLFRGFLQGRLAADGGGAAVTALQVRSAAALADTDRPEGAVALYLEAGDAEATLGVLRERGYPLLEVCAQPLLSRWIAALGAGGERYAGWALLLEGWQSFQSADLPKARRRLEAALPLLAGEGGGRYLTLRALSRCCSAATDDDDSVAYARQAVEASEGGERAQSLRALAQVLTFSCRWEELDEALAAFAACGPAPSELKADMMLTAMHRDYRSGDVRAALSAAELALPPVRRDASCAALGGLLTGLGGFNLYACRYARGMRYLEEARRVLSAHGPLFILAQVEVTQAAALAQQGRRRECLALLDELAAGPPMATNTGVLCYANLVAAATLRRAGEPARAVQSGRRALESLPGDATIFDRLEAQVDLAFAEGLCGAPKHAVARLRALREEASSRGLRFQATKAEFFVGALALRAGEEAGPELAPTLAELLRLGHLDFLGQELVANPEVAAWLPSAALDDEDLRELLRVTALQGGGPALVASLAGRGDGVLALLLSLARTDLPARQATLLLQTLRRHPSREVRARARRLDLDAESGAARLFLELTPREEEILALLADGCSNEDVASRLVLTVGTVKSHVHRILAKTDSSGRLAAAMLYRRRAAPAGGDGDQQSGQ